MLVPPHATPVIFPASWNADLVFLLLYYSTETRAWSGIIVVIFITATRFTPSPFISLSLFMGGFMDLV